MTRDEYLKQLKNNILSLSSDEQAEAIQYYSDYFEEANDDEKVIEELGAPEELAKTIIEKFANALVDSSEKKSEKKDEQTDAEYSSDGLYFEYESKSVKNLTMNLGAAEIVLIPGKVFSVETRGIERNAMNCYLNGDGTLIINNSKRLNLNFFNHNRKVRVVPRVLITIPENAKLGKMIIAVGAGNCRAKDISASFNYGNFSVGAGNLVLKSLNGGKMDLRCGMGNLCFEGASSGISNIDCGMGNVTLNLKGNADDYSYDAKIGLGDFKFNDEKKSGVCQVLNNHKKENHFSVNCGMGSVNIKIQ